MKRREIEGLTRPFIAAFMGDQFTAATTLSDWYRQLDDSIESRLHNGPRHRRRRLRGRKK